MPRYHAATNSEAGPCPRPCRHRYWAVAALGVLTLASPLAIAAAPAAAQGIQLGSVSGDGSGDLTVTVTTPAPLTAMTIHLTGQTGGQTLSLPLSDFILQSQAGPTDTYALRAAGTSLSGLAPDTYTAAGDATDADGDQVTGQAIGGEFSFLAQPSLAFSSPAFSTTEPNQPVSLGGQIGCITVACPSSWSGTSVTVTDTAAGTQWTASANSAGHFSVSVTGVPGHNYSASVQATATTLALIPPLPTTLDVPQYAVSSITATAKPAPYGKQSITGQLTYQPTSSFSQLGAPSGVQVTATDGPDKFSTTTGSDGNFSLALPAITGTTTWQLSTQNDLTTTPFLAGTQASVDATQLWPVKITGFTARLDKYGYVTVAGCMSATISQRPPTDYPPMDFQWRARRSGRWHLLGSLPTTSRDGCAGAGFFGSGRAPAASAYYRAYFPGDNVYASAYSASTGRVWKYPTRFDPFRTSSRSVRAGQRVTISGTLQYRGKKWLGYRRQRIVIIYSRTGKGNTWYVLKWVKTNRRGRFRVTFDDYASEYWSANFGGNARHLAVSASPIRVKVHGRARSGPVTLAGQQPAGRASPALGGTAGTRWPFVLSADPLLTLMAG